MKTDSDGTQRWITFAKEGFADDNDVESTRDFYGSDLATASDGGFVVVGWATYVKDAGNAPRTGSVAGAAKVAADGSVAWARRLSLFDEDEVPTGPTDHPEELPGAAFHAVAPTSDGGALAGGSAEGDSWLVRFDGEGRVTWKRTYVGYRFQAIEPRAAGGYHAIVKYDDAYESVVFDGTGDVSNRVTLRVNYEKTPYNHDFTWTNDGGYAYTGRDRGHENMVLGKLDADGTRLWREEYDGPYGGDDWANQVVQTRDGGYALGGYMRAAYTGEHTATILRTDGDGNERWRRLFTDAEAADTAEILRSDDGGYACLLSSTRNEFVKLAPDDPSTGTPVGTATEGSPTEGTPTEATPTEGTPTEGTTAGTPTNGTPTEEAGGDCDI